MADEILKDRVREVASETIRSPGLMLERIMALVDLDYGTAEEIDRFLANFYHGDLTAKLNSQERLIASLRDQIDQYERNFESPLT